MHTNLRTPLETRLWQRVTKTDTCWLWTGHTVTGGYGKIYAGGSRSAGLRVHRVAFELAYGPIPEGMDVCHVCDNPACCRNDDEGWYELNGVLLPRRGHLWLGTNDENMADMVSKGRSPRGERNARFTHPETTLRGDAHPARMHPERMARGERNGHATLTADQVREIRARYASGTTGTSLAAEFGIRKCTVYGIINRKSWQHVE